MVREYSGQLFLRELGAEPTYPRLDPFSLRCRRPRACARQPRFLLAGLRGGPEGGAPGRPVPGSPSVLVLTNVLRPEADSCGSLASIAGGPHRTLLPFPGTQKRGTQYSGADSAPRPCVGLPAGAAAGHGTRRHWL